MSDGFGSQPQFDTAEFKSEGNACAFCKTALSAGYYRVQGKLACANCTQKIQNSRPQDSHSAFVRASIFGSVAAVVGMAAYAGVVIATGWTIGYLALGVGYIIAKAMMKGSGNVGGRRYQTVAVMLTYAAISIAAVPIAFHEGTQRLSLITIVLLGLASPILEFQSPGHGILGAIILFVGLRIAWSIAAGTRKLSIEGPY
jgi:hypothetical protein